MPRSHESLMLVLVVACLLALAAVVPSCRALADDLEVTVLARTLLAEAGPDAESDHRAILHVLRRRAALAGVSDAEMALRYASVHRRPQGPLGRRIRRMRLLELAERAPLVVELVVRWWRGEVVDDPCEGAMHFGSDADVTRRGWDRRHVVRCEPTTRNVFLRRLERTGGHHDATTLQRHSRPQRSGPEVSALPRTRGDCVDGERPCPHTTCRQHLAEDVERTARWRGARAARPRELPPGADSCALDVADRGSHTLAEVGDLLGVCRERVRQIEVSALRKVNRLRLAGRVHLDVYEEPDRDRTEYVGGGRDARVSEWPILAGTGTQVSPWRGRR